MTNTERAVQALNAAHDQLATFARQSYASDGRGVIQVGVPEPRPGQVSAALVVSQMAYHTLDEIRRLTRGLRGTGRNDADVLIRMVETYDPAQQAVVMLAIGEGDPISVKMRLDRPIIVEDVGGVH